MTTEPMPAILIAARPRAGPIRRALKALCSLRLTVALLAMAVFLVFASTLAQIDEGVWTVVNKYFRTFTPVWIPLKIFFPRTWSVPALSLLFPSGWMIGAALFVNLLAAHAVRFKMTWPRAGIFLIHAGLIVMLTSEVGTGLLATEGNMKIDVGGSSNFIYSTRKVELAFVSEAPGDSLDAVVVPESMLRRGGRISHPDLPVEVEVIKFMANSGIANERTAQGSILATAGLGLSTTFEEKPEVSGTDPDQPVDLPSAYVKLKTRARAPLGTWLVSTLFDDEAKNRQTFATEGRTWDMSLRFKREYKPYVVRLKEWRHKDYEGTKLPMTFSSLVQLKDDSRGVDREVDISMNSPLRYSGETFFQAGFDEANDTFTILQVVRNPGWPLPYLSFSMVVAGLAVQFGIHLVKFLKRRAG